MTLLKTKAEAAASKAESEAFKKELIQERTIKAQNEVATAVARGAIAAKDETSKAEWVRMIVEDPKKVELLRKMRGHVSLDGASIKPISAQGSQPMRIVPNVSISREDSQSVLAKMAGITKRNADPGLSYTDKRQAAREFAAIYAKEITPRLREGDDIPIQAANTLGTLASTLVATRSLELLTLTFPMLDAITTDFSDQIVSYGDVLKTRYITIPTVQTFNTSTGWPTDSSHVTTDVSITYNQWKGVPFTFLSQEIAGTVRRLFDEAAGAQAYALGKSVVDYVYALITATAFTNTPTSAALLSFDRSKVIDIGGALDDKSNPQMGRTLLLNRPYYSKLAQDSAIVTLAAYTRNDIITAGVLPDVEGMRVVKAVNLPGTAIGAKTLKGFGFTRSALVLATRLSADYVNAVPGAGHGNLSVVTTPGGISANLVQYVNHSTASVSQRLEVIYGASAGNPDAGQILTD
jgi:hypothetical protein